ncbi:hypothetical protein [Peribacillus simplex]|uniref:Uncharacterized protein n=1 Tax=Peribacillus simplex TaxID=1478 RepID=A0AAW7IJS9_9BACI|nr:hypothetical protein [Peribacillus simplex]MDM5455341.1 hypothetical protein [Peribacillus simplex]
MIDEQRIDKDSVHNLWTTNDQVTIQIHETLVFKNGRKTIRTRLLHSRGLTKDITMVNSNEPTVMPSV